MKEPSPYTPLTTHQSRRRYESLLARTPGLWVGQVSGSLFTEAFDPPDGFPQPFPYYGRKGNVLPLHAATRILLMPGGTLRGTSDQHHGAHRMFDARWFGNWTAHLDAVSAFCVQGRAVASLNPKHNPESEYRTGFDWRGYITVGHNDALIMQVSVMAPAPLVLHGTFRKDCSLALPRNG